jgi:hypothetical protein
MKAVFGVPSGVQFSSRQALVHMSVCARSARVFASRWSATTTGFCARFCAQFRALPRADSLLRVRHAKGMVGGRRPAGCAWRSAAGAPHPRAVRPGKAQGKIEGAGTLPAHERVCTWGWRGTRLWTAPCRQVSHSLLGIGETACMARPGAMAFAGAAL